MKNLLRTSLSIVLLLLAYTLCYFLIPVVQQNKTVFALNYVFAAIAFLFQIYVFYLVFFKNETLKSKVYGLPILKVSIIYLIISLLYNLAIFILNIYYNIPTILSIIVPIIFIVFVLIGIFITTGVKEEVERQDEKLNVTTSLMDNLKNDFKVFMASYDYQPLQKKINDLYELVIYSDPVSDDKLIDIEDEINKTYLMLKNAYNTGDYNLFEQYIEQLQKLVNERNIICKMNK